LSRVKSLRSPPAVKLIKAGDKVSYFEAALLLKLGKNSFSSHTSWCIDCIFDNGLNLRRDPTLTTPFFAESSPMLLKRRHIPLQIGCYPTPGISPPMTNSKSLVAIVVGLDSYRFEKARPSIAFLTNPDASAVAAPAAPLLPVLLPQAAAPKAAEEEADAPRGRHGHVRWCEAGGGDYYKSP
jgi:hypothetical protein